MKTRYMAKEQRPDGSFGLTLISLTEWVKIITQNFYATPEERRYFIHDVIIENRRRDCLIYEAPREMYQEWNRDHIRELRNRAFAPKEAPLSLDAPLQDGSMDSLVDTITDDSSMEDAILFEMVVMQLRLVLAEWRPWAVDMLDYYLQGKKRKCCSELSEKYHMSDRGMRKNRVEFEMAVKNYFAD